MMPLAVSHDSSHKPQLSPWRTLCVITNVRASHMTGSLKKKKGTSAYWDNVSRHMVYYISNLLLIPAGSLSDSVFLLSGAINWSKLPQGSSTEVNSSWRTVATTLILGLTYCKRGNYLCPYQSSLSFPYVLYIVMASHGKTEVKTREYDNI